MQDKFIDFKETGMPVVYRNIAVNLCKWILKIRNLSKDVAAVSFQVAPTNLDIEPIKFMPHSKININTHSFLFYIFVTLFGKWNETSKCNCRKQIRICTKCNWSQNLFSRNKRDSVWSIESVLYSKQAKCFIILIK